MIFGCFQWHSMVFVAYMIILPMPRCGGVASPGVHKVFILLFIYYYYYYFIIPPCPWCLCLVQTGLFACKPCLKYSRIHGTKVQSCIECVKGQRLLTVFDSFQWFSMFFNGFKGFSLFFSFF